MTSVDQTRRTGGAAPAQRSRKSAADHSRVQAALGWTALALVAWALLRNGGYAPLIWLVMCLGTLGLFAVQVALDVRTGLPRQARTALWVSLPFFGVVVWVLAQGMPGLPAGWAHPVWAAAPEGSVPAISVHPDAGRPVALRFTCYAMLFWILLRTAAAARNGAHVYIQAIALFSTALALYGMVSLAIGYNWLLAAGEDAVGLRASLWNRNTYATVAVFGILANVTAYLQAVSGSVSRDGLAGLRDFLETFFSRAWVFAFGALVLLAALTMTLSRGGAVSGLIGVLVLIWGLRSGAGKVSLRATAIPVALFAFVVLFMTSGVLDRLGNIGIEGRPEIYRQVWAGVLDRPLLGHGAGTFVDSFSPYVPLSQGILVWDRAHNSYLENAFEFGLPAAGVLFLTLGLIGGRLLQGVRTRKRYQSTPAFALACFAAAAVHAMVDFSLQVPAVAALFAAILGIGWGQSFPTRRKSDEA
ncbi:MAG: O-antigen ligase family protein [Paracoccaceae bacterium]